MIDPVVPHRKAALLESALALAIVNDAAGKTIPKKADVMLFAERKHAHAAREHGMAPNVAHDIYW